MSRASYAAPNSAAWIPRPIRIVHWSFHHALYSTRSNWSNQRRNEIISCLPAAGSSQVRFFRGLRTGALGRRSREEPPSRRIAPSSTAKPRAPSPRAPSLPQTKPEQWYYHGRYWLRHGLDVVVPHGGVNRVGHSPSGSRGGRHDPQLADIGKHLIQVQGWKGDGGKPFKPKMATCQAPSGGPSAVSWIAGR
jgi:hypothetical protein